MHTIACLVNQESNIA